MELEVPVRYNENKSYMSGCGMILKAKRGRCTVEGRNMQMDGRLGMLLSALAEDFYIDMSVLTRKMQLSERTVRKLLNQLDDQLKENGAVLERRRGMGVRIQVVEREIYQQFMKEKAPSVIPENGRQRVEFILAQLFSTDDYIKAEWLCERLYISRKTLSLDLKTSEQYLNRHGLQLERKPHHGMKIVGSEFAVRICLSTAFYEFSNQWFQNIYRAFPDPEWIRGVMLHSVQQCSYSIYETDISNMILQIQTALYRWQQGYEIRLEEIQDSGLLQEQDIRAAQICAAGLEKRLKKSLPVSEIKYLAIQFLGKKRVLSESGSGLFIDMEVNRLVNQMLEQVHQTFGLDLSSDFDLNTSLRQHMVSMRIRLQYGLKLENPMMREIKEVYGFPYAVAAHASTVLSEYFHTIVPEEEIGYLALCFALSMERQEQQEKRRYQRNILLVCASGHGSAKLFEYRFREMFGDYLNRVETCDAGSLTTWNFTDIDYVFSTVPINYPIPVPVCQVQYFFDRHNAGEVERILRHNANIDIARYFQRNLFFTDVKGDTREEVLHHLCGLIGQQMELPEDFEDCVLQREQRMQTDLCPLIAIPHPYKPITRETFVCTAILEKPIKWHIYQVQVVFLLSLSEKNENLEDFYRIAPKFMMDEGGMNRLIAEKTYDTLIGMIRSVERREEGSN